MRQENLFEIIPKKYRGTVQRAFKGIPIAETLEEDLIVYRHWGGKASETGSPWYSTKNYNRPGNAQRYLALPQGNSAENVTVFRIAKGTPHPSRQGCVNGWLARLWRQSGWRWSTNLSS